MTQALPHICFLAPHAFPLLANDPDVPFVGGAELQQMIIAKGLVQRGYPVSMICLDYGQDDRIVIDGVTVHRAYRPNDGLPVIRFIWPRLSTIWRCLNQVGADIYYQRSANMMTGVLAAFGRRHAKKTVFAVAGETKIRFARDRQLFEYGVKHVDRIVVQNAMQERSIREQVGRDCVLIPNAYEAPQPSRSVGGRYVLWAATIRHVKRPDIFLDLAEALPDFQFVVVGGPSLQDRSLYPEIRARAQALSNVHFAGFVPYAEVGHWFDEAMLFVSTSDNEGFPNTFLQSWVRSIPTISFVDSGARLDGAVVGVVVDTPQKMKAAIANLAENRGERSRLGKKCKQYVEDTHAPDRVLDQYEHLFHGMLHG